ncbi:AzlC family ABC transporter permease [Paeniglutamicibacter sp. Y32M11]|nr:AzlC family ABC transporter permease [Paeniglutamicibacter sp. Y32M11]
MTRLEIVPSTFFTPATKIGLSISVATGLYAISYGALGVAAGLNVWQIAALSLLMFTGGSQFAFIGVIAGGGSPGAAFGAATLLGVRNAVYGMQVKSMIRPRGLKKLLAVQLTIDESTATAAGQGEPAEQKRGFWVAGMGVYILWNIFTIVGALLGDAMGDPKTWGLDGAAVAAFLGLLWPRLKSSEPIAVASVCALVTVLAVPLVPPGVPILVAAIVAGVWGYFGRGPSDEGLEPDVKPRGTRGEIA